MIKIKCNASGKPVSIDLTDVPLKPTEREADAVIAEISVLLGLNLEVVKLRGCWILGDVSPEASKKRWYPVYGHRFGEQTRSFDVLIRRGLQITTVRSVSVER